MKKFSHYINIFLKLIQKYCSMIIPNDDHEEGYFIINRSMAIVIIVFCIACILIIRLLFIVSFDIYKHRHYSIKKIKPFKRLEIVDRNGNVLASNIEVYNLYLQSSKMKIPEKDIDKINSIIPNAIANKQVLLEKLAERKNSNRIVFVKNGITTEQRQKLIDEDVKGIIFEPSEKRFYTSISANSVTGYCTAQDKCISGIEKSMNSYLRVNENEPLRLSIDVIAQNILYDTLNKRMVDTRAKSAAGIIMNIKTGEVMASVSLPSCDYNNYGTCQPDDLFNRYSLGVYELGSIFKLFLVAISLQSGISPYKKYPRIAYKIDELYTIHDIDKAEEKGGELNLVDIIRYSSNVGCAKIMEDIELKNQIKFMSRLGLLSKLQTELPETGKPIFPKRWTFVNGITISYGHGIAVTPLHYVTALASLLKNSPVRPTFLATNDDEKYEYHYLDDDKFKLFKEIMRQVINSGSGHSAYIDKYDVGGKTGTAIQYHDGKYDRHSMILSFVTAVPMKDPQYIFYLMLDRPHADASNDNLVRASNILGKTMNDVISTIGPILNIKPINKKTSPIL